MSAKEYRGIKDIEHDPSFWPLLSQWVNDQVVTEKSLEQTIYAFRNSNNAPVTFSDSEIVAGVLGIRRYERRTYIRPDTEGQVATDDLDTITMANVSDGDELFLFPNTGGRTVRVRDNSLGSGNIRLKAPICEVKWNGDERFFIHLVYINEVWEEKARFDEDALRTFYVYWARYSVESSTIATGGAVLTKNNLKIYGAVIGETRAEAEWTISGTSFPVTGTCQIYVQIGAGSQSICNISFSAIASDALLATEIRNGINALSGISGFDDQGAGTTVKAQAPEGTGSSANAYISTFTLNITVGAATATLVSDFAGGVDGYNGKDDLVNVNIDALNLPAENEGLIMLENGNTTGGQYLNFLDTGNLKGFATPFYLGPGQAVLALAKPNGDLHMVKGVAGSGSGAVSFKSVTEFYGGSTQTIYGVASAVGAANGLGVLGPEQYVNLAATLDRYTSCDFLIPENYMPSSDLTIELGLVDIGAATAGNDFIILIGGQTKEYNGSDRFGSPTLHTTLTEGGYGSTETMFKVTATLPATTYGFSPGEIFEFTILRNGTSGSDTATGSNLGVRYAKASWITY